MSYVTGRLPDPFLIPDDAPVHESIDAAEAAALERSDGDPAHAYGVWWRNPDPNSKDGSRVLKAIAFQGRLFIPID